MQMKKEEKLKVEMDGDNALQSAAVFDWDGDDEERFAMEKVHGLNDFDNDDQTKFSTIDENGFGGDDEWRALAEAQPLETANKPISDEEALATESQEEKPASVSEMQISAAEVGEAQPTVLQAQPAAESGGADIRIMRFTRKRTPNQRGRRKLGALVSPTILMEKSELIQQEQPVSVKSESEASALQAQQGVHATRSSKIVEAKCVLVKASSYDDLMEKDGKTVDAQARKLMEERRITRLKQQRAAEEQPQSQNKKPKALAFQKSRNIINKRINGEAVKPEPAFEVDCSEVTAMRGKQIAVAAEFQALREEIHPLVAGEDEEGFKEIPSALQQKWMDLHCKQLLSKFDLNFAVAQHFLCHSSEQCTR